MEKVYSVAELQAMMVEAEKAEREKTVSIPAIEVPVSTVKSHLSMVIEPTFDNVLVKGDFSPKDAIENGFLAGVKKSEEYFKLAKWAARHGMVRKGKHDEGLNIWSYLGSLYADNGWPRKSSESEVFVSVDTAKKELGKLHPAVLRIQAFKQWVSNHFDPDGDGWVLRTEEAKNAKKEASKSKVVTVNGLPANVPSKEELLQRMDDAKSLQALVNANTDKIRDMVNTPQVPVSVNSVTSSDTEKSVEQSLKERQNDALLNVVKVAELTLDQEQKLQREVLFAIIQSSKVTDKAKRLSIALMSELGIAEA